MAADRIQVDPDALEKVASEIALVQDSLSGAKALFSDPYGGVADHNVLGALQDFNASWNQKRGHLESQLGSAADALNGAAESFRSEDAKLASAMQNNATQENN